MDREYYLTYAKLNRHKRNLDQAQKIIKSALKIDGVWAVSCSGGKDSVSLLDLCVNAGWHGPIFHFYYDETPADNTKLVKALAEHYCLDLHLLKVPGAWEVYEQVGHFFVHPVTEEEKRATRKMLREYKATINRFMSEKGWVGQFLGLRKGESNARRMTLSKKGTAIYTTNDRTTWTACPLSSWSSADVWAYILTQGLPYLPCYETAADPERERSEVTWLASEFIWRHGMAARLKRERPDEFNRLALRYPEIRLYT